MEVTIVALPSQEDAVNKYSSEKLAHLTLLYLGEVDPETAARIISFVQHASTMMRPFGLGVDYRGELGADNADVLFFEKEWAKDIATFRTNLLANNDISKAYHSTDQYPEWTPHLTMGYPETPAKEDDREYPGFNWVNFDRISVWIGDFQGPEFRLRYDDRAMEVAMSDTATDPVLDFLEHQGVKGMKWGVRNDKGHEGEQVKTKKLDKLDKKWEQNESRNAFWQAHNAAADKMNNGEIDRINNKPEHAKAAAEGKFNDWDNPSPELNAYMKDMDDTFAMHMREAVVARGSNPSGSKRYELRQDDEGNAWAELVDVKHSDIGTEDVRFKITRDDNGMVTKYTPEKLNVEHSYTEAGAEFLEHYGVKGMKWGVTTVDKATKPTVIRESTSKKPPADITVTQRKPGTFVKSKGGQRHSATEEAVKAQAARQKAKRSTTDSLTNDELKASTERMRLEREFKAEVKKQERVSLGARFMNAVLEAKGLKEPAQKGKKKN